jgi:1-deoxy-D-xylulose-5-phosphate synthase
VALLAIGTMVGHAMQAAELLAQQDIEAEVVNMRFAKPIDEELLRELTHRIKHVVTIEENVVDGGFGSAVLESLAAMKINNVFVKVHGLPENEFIQHGSPAELYRLTHLDAAGIAEVTVQALAAQKNHGK